LLIGLQQTSGADPMAIPNCIQVQHCQDKCRLSGLSTGCSGRVLSVSGDVETRRRLLEMGFCNGVMVESVRRAPLGDPVEFSLRGYRLCLRLEQASCITVEPSDSRK
jgi:ferrous iron transport protein A